LNPSNPFQPYKEFFQKQEIYLTKIKLFDLCTFNYLYYKKYRSDAGGIMPIIEIHVLQGYDAAQKTRLCKALTNAARTVIPATPDAVTVMIKEMPATDYMRGGQHRSPAPALPDAPPMTELDDLLEWAAPRYRFVKKTIASIDLAPGDGPATVVYCHGTLSGEWPDGTAFSDIRFIDRFEVTDGFITRQDVWNDIAETKAQP
jgi:4-oxalocrotonate tautomerase family enzyme